MFGLALLSVYRESGEGEASLAYGVATDHIWLAEPFLFSPTKNGVSAAFLTTQKSQDGRLWDFAIHTANDNAATFAKSKLSTLIDVDGFNAHRESRQRDAAKSASTEVKSIRIYEELFTGVEQMAIAALYETVWLCDCWGNGKCSVCETILSRLR